MQVHSQTHRPAPRADGATPPKFSLPNVGTPFFGRDDELAAIRQLLVEQPAARLLTLTGAGGTGKTRLACTAAVNVAPAFGDRVHFVDLSTVAIPNIVAASIAQALRIQDTGSQPLEAILFDVLGELPTLLVLDNFEQVIGAAQLVVDLLQHCPDLTVIVTSREPLHVRLEQIFPVRPLAVPGTTISDPLAAAINPSVALFLDRGRACNASFELTANNLPSVAGICTHLDGLPLAIELAAAQLRVLSPQAILERLRSRAPLPFDSARDVPARHRTLRAAVASSYDLLDEAEQQVFRWSSVFAGGVTPDAASAVCPPLSPDIDVLRVLAQLADKSLITATEEPDGQPRFRWLETIRAEALDRLAEQGELEHARQRHAAYFRQVAERAEASLTSPGAATVLDQLEYEYENLRAVFHWSANGGDSTTGLAVAGSLLRFWMLRGHLGEARSWLDDALPRGEAVPLPTLAKAYNAAGVLAGLQDDNPRAQPLFERGLVLWQQVGDFGRIAAAMGNLGLIAQNRQEVDTALAWFEASQANYERAGDRRGVAIAIGSRARLAHQQRRHEAARSMFEETVGLFRALGDEYMLSNSLANLGHAALALGELEAAFSSYSESLAIRRTLGTTLAIAECFEGLAAVAGAAGRPRRAARLYGAADTLREVTGAPVSGTDRTEHDDQVARIRQRLGERSFSAEWTAGRATDVNDAAALALEATSQDLVDGRAAGTSGRGVLTRRERDVALLVAQGRTNRDVARELLVAERTVETHLEHIFHKLGVQTRAEVAVWITRQDLAADQSSLSELVEPPATGGFGNNR